MLKFNLLSPGEKKQIELAELHRLVVIFVAWIFVFLLAFVVLLTSTFFSLSILLKSQNTLIQYREQDEKNKYLVKIEQKIKQANQKLDRVYLKQSNMIIWTPILEKLAKITPSGVYITNFSYQSSNEQINLGGWADNRNKLLVFQDSLEQASDFVKVDAPLSNLIKQSDISFGFILYLK